MTETSTQGQSPGEKAPGWYPDRASPNLQKYWDGGTWIAQRRWMGAQWVNEPLTPAGMPGAGPGAVPGMAGAYPGFGSRPPGAGSTQRQPVRTGQAVTGAGIVLLISCILIIVGSFTTWFTISLASLNVSVSGTDSGVSFLIGVNGWITFAGALLLFILFCMTVVSGEPIFRTLAVLVAVATAGFAVYDLVRISQKISQVPNGQFGPVQLGHAFSTNASVGWGLIVVVIGAAGALLGAVFHARNA